MPACWPCATHGELPGRDFLGDQPADREAADHRLLDAEMIHQPDEIGAERLDAVGAGREIGEAVAALVVAERPIATVQPGAHPVPDAKIGAERVGEHQGRPVGAAVQVIMHRKIADSGEARRPLPFRRQSQDSLLPKRCSGDASAPSPPIQPFKAEAQTARG
jgi:hypothetical protein